MQKVTVPVQIQAHPALIWADSEGAERKSEELDGGAGPNVRHYVVVHTEEGQGILGYLVKRWHTGELYDVNGLLPKATWDPKIFEEQRRQAWLVQLDVWRAQHGLTRAQAASVLNDSTKPLTLRELYWAEVHQFVARTIAEEG